MSSHIEWFVDYKQFNNNLEVRIGDGTKITAYGKSNINILVFANGNWTKNHLSDVLYVPEIKVNFFPSGACLDKGIKMVSDKNMCKFIKNGKTVAVGTRDNKLFTMKFKPLSAQEIFQANVTKKVDTLEQWHQRLCHQNIQYVRKSLSHMQIPFVEPNKEFFCEACIYGK